MSKLRSITSYDTSMGLIKNNTGRTWRLKRGSATRGNMLDDFFLIKSIPSVINDNTYDNPAEYNMSPNSTKNENNGTTVGVQNVKTEQIFQKAIIWIIQFFIFSTINIKILRVDNIQDILKTDVHASGINNMSYSNRSVVTYFMLIILFSYIDHYTSFLPQVFILLSILIIINYMI